jgi:hypothetical protein
MAAMYDLWEQARIQGQRELDEYHCARFTKTLHSNLLRKSYFPWTIQINADRIGTGEPCCSIILRIDTYSICITFSIKHEGNRYRSRYDDAPPDKKVPFFEPTDCEMLVLTDDGIPYHNNDIGYVSGIVLFRGNLGNIIFHIIGETDRLQQQLMGNAEPPPYAIDDAYEQLDDDEPPPY